MAAVPDPAFGFRSLAGWVLGRPGTDRIDVLRGSGGSGGSGAAAG